MAGGSGCYVSNRLWTPHQGFHGAVDWDSVSHIQLGAGAGWFGVRGRTRRIQLHIEFRLKWRGGCHTGTTWVDTASAWGRKFAAAWTIRFWFVDLVSVRALLELKQYKERNRVSHRKKIVWELPPCIKNSNNIIYRSNKTLQFISTRWLLRVKGSHSLKW